MKQEAQEDTTDHQQGTGATRPHGSCTGAIGTILQGVDCARCQEACNIGPVTAVAAGGGHTCAVQADGTLVCFGANDYGQCAIPADFGPLAAPRTGRHFGTSVITKGDLHVAVDEGIPHAEDAVQISPED